MSANTETTGAVKVGDVFERVTDIDSHRRAGSQFTIEEVDGEGAHWERRLYCLSPRYLIDETRYKRVVTPPIAAPAAHVERRKGQRWRLTGDPGVSREFTLLGRTDDGTAWLTDDPEPLDEYSDGSPNNVADCCWDAGAGFTMVLLADAPPEPLTAKDVFGEIPPGSKFTNETPVKFASAPPAQEAPKLRDVLCLGGCGLRIVLLSPLTWMCPTCVGKRAEAPKAAPEQFWFTDDEGEKIGPFATGLEADDASVTYGAWMRTQTGKPYAGPERLPRPRLAADWVEDCLPTVWR